MANKFDGGVRYYTIGTATISIPFPESDICCQNCRLLTNDYGLKRARCAYTAEVISDPEYGIGNECPLNFKEEKL